MILQTLKNLRRTAPLARGPINKGLAGNLGRRAFSSGKSQVMSGGQKLGMGLGLTAIGGLTYLSYLGHQMRAHATPEQRLSLFHPTVQQRLRHTMGYFTAGCFATGGLMHVMRGMNMGMGSAIGTMVLSFGCLFGIMLTDYERQFMMKNAFYGGFVAATAASMVPMIHAYGGAVLFDALLCTGATMGGLGAVAWNAPSEQFMKMGGVLACGLGGLLGASLLSIFYPGSPALWNIQMYGGIALFSLFVLYDTQMIMNRAKTQNKYDPVRNALTIYLDAVNLFVRFAAIMGGNKKK